MSKENIVLWHYLNQNLFLNDGHYNITEHIDILFKRNQSVDFKTYLEDSEYIFEQNYKEIYIKSYSNELTKCLIAKSILGRNINSLDFLVNTKEGEVIRFYSLLQLLSIFHGCYVLDKIATSSDFWSVVKNGRVNNKTFLSFHVLNYCYHIGKKITDEDNCTSNVSNILNLTVGGQFYDESLIAQTIEFLSKFIDKLIAIVQSSVFDEQFINLFTKYNPLSLDESVNPNPMPLTQYLSESIMTNWGGETPLAVRKMKALGLD